MFACIILIDLQKVFDTAKQNILLHKLGDYEMTGLPNKWFQSFLLEKSQYTSIKYKILNKLHITHGVPQGSVLGALLFILYINDFNEAIIHSAAHHFVDDTILLYRNKSLKNEYTRKP